MIVQKQNVEGVNEELGAIERNTEGISYRW